VVMGPVDTGVVADIGWPDSTVGAVGAVVQDDVTGTIGPASGDGGPGGGDNGGPGNGGVRDESRSYTCDPNDGDGLQSYTSIPTTELDQDVIHLVEMMMRAQAVRPLIVTMGEERDGLRGWFIVRERFQDRRRTTTSDYAIKIEKRLMEQRSLAIRCLLRVFEIDHVELLVYLHGSKTID